MGFAAIRVEYVSRYRQYHVRRYYADWRLPLRSSDIFCQEKSAIGYAKVLRMGEFSDATVIVPARIIEGNTGRTMRVWDGERTIADARKRSKKSGGGWTVIMKDGCWWPRSLPKKAVVLEARKVAVPDKGSARRILSGVLDVLNSIQQPTERKDYIS
jgi:hypothetical protein